MKGLHMVTFMLAMVGALNWGLIGIFGFNLVSTLVGTLPMVEKLVYVLVGASAVVELATHMKNCRVCGK